MRKGPGHMEENRLLEEAQKNARSFPGLVPPNQAEEIGQVKGEQDTYTYYRDSGGNYYYSSGRTQRFEIEMQEAQERKRKRERQRRRQKKRAV